MTQITQRTAGKQDHRQPFDVVTREERRPPLRQLPPAACEHARAYQTDKRWAGGTHWVCADCGRCSKFARDLGGDRE